MRKYYEVDGTNDGGGSNTSQNLEPLRKVEGSGNEGAAPVNVEISNIPNKDSIEDFLDKVGTGIENTFTTGFPVELKPPRIEDGKIVFEQTWDAIDNSKLNFDQFTAFINTVINGDIITGHSPEKLGPTSLLFNSQAYNLLKFATTVYVRKKLGFPESDSTTTLPGSSAMGVLPYYETVLKQLDKFSDALEERKDVKNKTLNKAFQTHLTGNRSEMLWAYWHDEGLLPFTMKAIALRFQNIRTGPADPLANLEMDTLRPLANVLFGYVQDEQHRLTPSRRNYEYQYQYGIRILGRNIPNTVPAVNRASFIEAFHNLLYRCIRFYELVDDRTKAADPFPLLSSLQEVNLLLTEGMHNQYNDLSLTSRIEMMMEQWILSRPEIKDFLRGKAMVVYKEPWMGVVDTMKNIQGWTSTSMKFYHDLAEYGEDILLSIRFVPWEVGSVGDVRIWANRYRESIQRYIYAYHAVTGVDISADPVSVSDNKYQMPSILLQQKYQRDKQLKG